MSGRGVSGAGTPDPGISVIVPVYRDWDRVPALLAALAAQRCRDFELVLVDNDPAPPDPDLPDHGSGHESGHGLTLRIIPCATPGSYAARNAGIAAARGGLLAFTDADCRPDPDWLEALATAHAADPGVILAGPIRLEPGPDPDAWEIFDTVRGMPQAVFVRHGYAATANLAVAAGVMAGLGGFDPARLSGGDAEFCRRAGGRGVGLRLIPGAVVGHPARTGRAAVVTKARRIKGGQLAAGPVRRRAFWTLRSLAPPMREMAGYLLGQEARRWPWAWRLTACRVRLALWGVELAELVRLMILRHPPERR